MKLVWENTNREALPDFKDFNRLYDELPRSKYVTYNDYEKLRKSHDEAAQNIQNYFEKLNNYYADLLKNKAKSANNNFKIMKGKRKKIFDEKDIENIRNLKKQKISNREIARKYHCDEKTIRNYLKN